MKQGELWLVNLNPTKGSEQSRQRPVVIVSGNLANTYLNVVICCPLASKIKNYKGNVVLKASSENGLTAPSEILTFHIRSIAKERLSKRLGTITPGELALIKSCFDDIWRY